MGSHYGQLDLDERCTIAHLRKAGQSIRQIAAALDRPPLTVSRELKRNAGAQVGYKPAYALAALGMTMDGLTKTPYHPERSEGPFYFQIFLPDPGSPSLLHIASTLSITALSMRIWRPHSRLLSPGNLSVASRPIFEPRPDTGLAKSK